MSEFRKSTENMHSSTNQRILQKLVDREVIMCGTDIVEYILKAQYEVEDAPFGSGDIENYYRKLCPDCGCELEEIDEEDIEPIQKWKCSCCDELYDTKEEAIKCCSDEEGTYEYEPTEVWLCPFCEDEYETEDEAKDCSCHYRETLYKCTGYNCEKYVLESDADEDVNEAYEWWFVTNWFADKLREHGEMIIDGWHQVWGRTCTGQAILLDGVIGKIAEEMGILVGQRNDWSKWMDK